MSTSIGNEKVTCKTQAGGRHSIDYICYKTTNIIHCHTSIQTQFHIVGECCNLLSKDNNDCNVTAFFCGTQSSSQKHSNTEAAFRNITPIAHYHAYLHIPGYNDIISVIMLISCKKYIYTHNFDVV